jgi:hypothetical protein
MMQQCNKEQGLLGKNGISSTTQIGDKSFDLFKLHFFKIKTLGEISHA